MKYPNPRREVLTEILERLVKGATLAMPRSESCTVYTELYEEFKRKYNVDLVEVEIDPLSNNLYKMINELLVKEKVVLTPTILGQVDALVTGVENQETLPLILRALRHARELAESHEGYKQPENYIEHRVLADLDALEAIGIRTGKDQ